MNMTLLVSMQNEGNSQEEDHGELMQDGRAMILSQRGWDIYTIRP